MSTTDRIRLLHSGTAGPESWHQFETSTDSTLTDSILSKFAGANISPYAAHVGEIIASQFRLSGQGIRLASNGYNNLALHRLRPEKYSPLAFGFGPDHIIREKGEDAGFSFLVIFGALMEYYHQDFLPDVLWEMALEMGTPPGLLVGRHHWRAQMHAFNGVLVNTRFGIFVDEFVRLNPSKMETVTQQLPNGRRYGSIPASPKRIAKALKALWALSTGASETLTIIGGDEAGLFAAMADRLLGLRTVVRSNSGEELRRNCGEQDHPQLVIVFSSPPTNALAESALQHLGITGEICRLEAEEAAKEDGDSSKKGIPGHIRPASTGGRIYWQSLFADVYGSDFMDLIRSSNADVPFGAVIGCAARVFEGIVADSNAGRRGSHPNFSRAATPGSYGAGLIETLINYFPGMSRARPRMEKPLRLSFADARSEYEKEVARLVALCDCAVCHDGPGDPSRDRRHCLMVIVESTIILGLLLAKTIVSSEVYPKRAGIEGFYLYWAGVRQELNRRKAEIAPEDRFEFIYRDALMLLKGGLMLSSCLCLFSATLPDVDSNALAFSCNGMVAYSGLLHGSIGYRREWDTSTRIMAGVIQYHGRVYRSVAADADLMEMIEKGQMIADPDTGYQIVEPSDPEGALMLKLGP